MYPYEAKPWIALSACHKGILIFASAVPHHGIEEDDGGGDKYERSKTIPQNNENKFVLDLAHLAGAWQAFLGISSEREDVWQQSILASADSHLRPLFGPI